MGISGLPCRALFVSSLVSMSLCLGDLQVASRDGKLSVRLAGETLVAADALTLADLSRAESAVVGGVGDWDEVRTMHGGDRGSCAYYREVGWRRDRVEMTWYVKFAPYQFGTDFPGHTYNLGGGSYELQLPLSALLDARYEAVVGSPLKPKRLQGVFDSDLEDGAVIANAVRYLVLRRDGQSIVFDLNPPGPHTWGRKSLLTEKDWLLARAGDSIVLRADMRRVKWGDARRFKVVIMTGDHPYDDVHSSSKRGHPPMLSPAVYLNCGARLKRYKTVDTSEYTAERGVGWLASSGLQIVSSELPAGIYRDQVKGSGKHTLRIDVPSGVYLVNLLAGSAAEASSPLQVYAGGEPRLRDLQTDRGQFTAKTLHTRAVDGQVRLSFEGGDWSLAALSLSALVYETEDYLFERPWFIRQAAFDRWFAAVEKIPDMPPITPVEVAADPMAWTWNGTLTTLEASLDSSRSALDTRESVRQRLALIKSGGFRGVVIGGLHFRFNHFESARHQIMLRNTRLAVEEAHRLGLKVVDHWDFNWVAYPGYPSMLELLDADPDCLQRHSNPLIVATSFCLNSEAFADAFVKYLVNHQRATNVDGHMIDEIQWIRAQYCFCDTCRRRFHEATGMRLPTDAAAVCEKNEEPVWRAYVKWRGRCVARLHGRLREALHGIRPDGIMLRYTSSFLSLPTGRGLELNDSFPWNVDYVGDEFHPDLVLQNWRVLFARIKNRQGAVASRRNAPTWILPKFKTTPGRTLYAWALGRMQRANVWYRSGDYALSKALNTWSWQMQDRDARPRSDVAVLLSQATRDLVADVNYYHTEHMGWLQTLAEENVQYDVILERDVTAGRLPQYAALVLPNTASLSDAQAHAIKSYVGNGGCVIAVYETGFFDENGVSRKSPALADVMNLRHMDVSQSEGTITCGEALGQGGMPGRAFSSSAPRRVVALRRPANSTVLAQAPDGPAIIETPYRQGAFYYLCGNFISQNYEPRAVSPRNQTTLAGRFVYKVKFDPTLNHLVRNLVYRATEDTLRTRAVNVPRGVVVTAFDQHSNDEDTIVLHLLNCSGKPQLRLGDTIDLPEELPQPAVLGDAVLHMRSKWPIREGLAATPFVEEPVGVGIERIGEGQYSVTVPNAVLRNYCVVRLRP